MKFTVIDRLDPERSLKLRISKDQRDAHLGLMNIDTGAEFARLDYHGGKVIIMADDTLTEVRRLDGSPISVAAPSSRKKNKVTSPNVTDLRCWTEKNGVFTFTFAETGESVSLEKLKTPGTKTPVEDPHEIMGQNELVYTVASSIAKKRHFALSGPTGVGKTTIVRWIAKQLGYNLVICPIARGTEAAHLVGEYLPVGPALFEWTDGPVTEAVRLSQQAPTILLFDEINRIGNIAELARIYSVLDDTRMLELKERRSDLGDVERLEVGDLMVAATMNPSDDEHADYVGVQDLDPALISRFSRFATVAYPTIDVEAKALVTRVPELDGAAANLMCSIAKRIRESEEVRFPVSFRELVSWAELLPEMGWMASARYGMINKAPLSYQPSIEGILQIAGQPS